MLKSLSLPNIFSSALPSLDGGMVAAMLRRELAPAPADVFPGDDWLEAFAGAVSRRDVFSLRLCALAPELGIRSVLWDTLRLDRPEGSGDWASWTALLRWAGIESEAEIQAGFARAIAQFADAQDVFNDNGHALRGSIAAFLLEGPASLKRTGGRWELHRHGSPECSLRVSYGWSPAVQLADAMLAVQDKRGYFPSARQHTPSVLAEPGDWHFL